MTISFLPAPTLNPGTIDRKTAAWLARIATGAYEDRAALEAAWPDRLNAFIEDERTDTQAWIGVLKGGEHAVVAFRGTEKELTDWMTDADIRRDDNPWQENGGCVHNGFLRAYNSVADRIIDTLKEFGEPTHIWICGHSLGGALATCAGAHLSSKGLNVAGICTIGQPRVGDKDFAASYKNAGIDRVHVRVAHIRDPVTRVPPSIMGWSHVGSRWLFANNGALLERPKWYHYLLDRISAWFGGSPENAQSRPFHPTSRRTAQRVMWINWKN